MQTFIDAVTGQPWQLRADDDVRLIDGVWQVFDVNGIRLAVVPETLEPAPEGWTPPEPEPVQIVRFSVREFRSRFSLDEQVAIRAASMTDMEVGLVYDDFQAAQYIDITDSDVAAGLDLYIAKGLLEPERKDELLTPQAA